MELEAEHLWVHSASHDFYDKKKHQQILIFSYRKSVSEKKRDFPPKISRKKIENLKFSFFKLTFRRKNV